MIDFLAPQWGSARTAHHQRAAMLKRRAAHCEFSLFATFAGWGADAARHPNLSVGTYARRLKIDGFPPATVWWRVAPHRAPLHRGVPHRKL